MDSALYAFMHALVDDECNIPHVCENASISDNSHDCDAMLNESLGVVDIPNIRLLKKNAKLNESNKLVEKYKKIAENSLEKLKEFEYLNMDLDAKLVLSNKLVDELKCENESPKMNAKCFIAKPIAKKNENICCNHVVVLDFVPIVCSTLKDKSVYVPQHKRNQKVERKAIKSKPLFKSQSKVLDGSKFVSICHHYDMIGHIRPQCYKLKRE